MKKIAQITPGFGPILPKIFNEIFFAMCIRPLGFRKNSLQLFECL